MLILALDDAVQEMKQMATESGYPTSLWLSELIARLALIAKEIPDEREPPAKDGNRSRFEIAGNYGAER